ncbi:MAG: hypothetical protein ACK5TK_06885 [Betaproteobacteria bacterium]
MNRLPTPSHSIPPHRWAAAVLLCAALLLAAQALGLAHRIEHARPAVDTRATVAPTHAANAHPAETHNCVALDAAALGCTIPALALPAPDRTAAGSDPLPAARAAPLQLRVCSYRSRAPPQAG